MERLSNRKVFRKLDAVQLNRLLYRNLDRDGKHGEVNVGTLSSPVVRF